MFFKVPHYSNEKANLQIEHWSSVVEIRKVYFFDNIRLTNAENNG